MLHSMLSRLDRRFFKVIEFHELNDMRTWEAKDKGGRGASDFLFGPSGTFRAFNVRLDEARVEPALQDKRQKYFTPGFFKKQSLWERSERLAQFNDLLLLLKDQ